MRKIQRNEQQKHAGAKNRINVTTPIANVHVTIKSIYLFLVFVIYWLHVQNYYSCLNVYFLSAFIVRYYVVDYHQFRLFLAHSCVELFLFIYIFIPDHECFFWTTIYSCHKPMNLGSL